MQTAVNWPGIRSAACWPIRWLSAERHCGRLSGDYNSGQVWLSGLEPRTGLELIRLPVGDDPQTLYQLVASGRQVYILGNSLLAYGY